MAQNPTQVSTTPPLPGLTLVQTVNGALETIATNFSGSIDPAADAFPYAVWADTSTDELKRRNAADTAWVVVGKIFSAPVYVDEANTFTDPQRGTVTTDNDLSFDLGVTNNFKCTPTGTGTLTFTNLVSGQSGFVLLDNSGGYAISAAATTKVSATALSTISAAGVYLLSYFTDGTSVYVVNSGALS